MIDLSILYRGPLASCNYDCSYCPFAKQHDTAVELAIDRQKLERFVKWCIEQSHIQLSIFFTPWGEALHRRWYQGAIQQLSHTPHVKTVAIQTNLAANLVWLSECNSEKVGLWCTYHPSEVSQAEFLKQVQQLDALSISHSVGIVGLKENFSAIEQMRSELPPSTYLWVNAFKDVPDYYQPDEIDWLEEIDPHFRTNTHHYPSMGRECDTGRNVISVDGDGNIRRCHFVQNIISNIYDPNFPEALYKRPCPKPTCECHIGYVHMPDLNLKAVYADRLLHRVPLEYEQTTFQATQANVFEGDES